MATRAEQSKLNGRKGGRPRKSKTPETREFPDLDSFPWRTHEGIPELTQDQQHGEYLTVEHARRGHFRSVWIRKPVRIVDTEPRIRKETMNEQLADDFVTQQPLQTFGAVGK